MGYTNSERIFKRCDCDGHASGVVLGMLVVFAGVFLMLHHLGVVHVENVFDLWPSLLVCLGIVKLFQRPVGGAGIIVSMLLIGIGVMLQLKLFGYVSFNIHIIWPVLTIVVGVMIVWFSAHHRRHHQVAVSENTLNKFIVFGGDESRVTTQAFDGGAVTVIFGGAVLDMRDADISAGEARLLLSAVFGGVEIRVPRHWEVQVHGSPILGGFENKTSVSRDIDDRNVRKLIVQGNAVFGGVELKN